MSVQSDRDKGCSSGSLTDSDFSDKSRQGEVEWGEGGEERGGERRGERGEVVRTYLLPFSSRISNRTICPLADNVPHKTSRFQDMWSPTTVIQHQCPSHA